MRGEINAKIKINTGTLPATENGRESLLCCIFSFVAEIFSIFAVK